MEAHGMRALARCEVRYRAPGLSRPEREIADHPPVPANSESQKL